MAEPSGDRSPSPDVSDDSAGSLSSASEPLLSRSVSPEAEENPQSRPNKAQASPPVRSPSPRPLETSPHFSPTAEGELPVRRPNASVTPSPTPERIVMLKPPKATPDHRRGQRSPSPSPMSPRKRVGRGGAERLEEVPEDEELRKLRRYGGEDEEEDEDRNGRRRRGGDERRYERRRDEDDYRYRDRHRGRYDEERGGSRRGRREEGSDEERRDRRRDRGERRDDRDDRRDDSGDRDNRRGRMDDRENRRDERRERGGEQENGKEGEQRREEPMEGANGKAAAVANGPARVNNPAITRTGGAYVPPFKLARMMQAVDDKSSKEYQRLTWDALRKSINGLINKVNIANIRNIVLELFSENLIRGRGLFARSLLKSQLASPTFTPVYAALLSVVNTKFPEIGELVLKRVVLQFRRAFKRNDKPLCLAAVKMIAHLVNQQVAHEVIALELLTLLLEKPTEDSFEVAAGFVKEVGATLMDLSPQGLHGIFEALRRIAQEGEVGIRAQYIFEDLSAARRTKFEAYPAVAKDLDLVETEDQITHEVSLEDNLDPETGLDIFKESPTYLEDEAAYEKVRKELLGEDSDEEEDGEEGDEEEESDEEEDEETEEQMQIRDETETNLVNLRRTIYLTIMSSVDFEEAGHKLLKIHLAPGQEMEICMMLLECCSQERTYMRYYGLLGQRFCNVNRTYQANFEECFVKQYSMIHRLETNKLRNVAKFFAHLLGTDALQWQVLGYIRLTEEDTTSSSRIFIKILFQELSEHLGLRQLNTRLTDPLHTADVEGIFPRDTPKNTRFSINFFTSIGLGGLTDGLREHLKNMPKQIMQQQPPQATEASSSDSESDSGSESESDSGSDSESDSDSESEDSEEERKRRRKKRRKA